MLNRLKIGQKLGLIGLAFAIPLALTTYFLLDEKDIKIDFATSELAGDEYLRPLRLLLGDVLEYRALVRRAHGERADSSESEAALLARTIDGHFDELAEIDGRLRSVLQTTPEELRRRGRIESLPRTMRKSWVRIKSAGASPSTEAETTRLVANVRAIIAHVGDSSKLILDPDLDTYYVMDALLLREPELLERLRDVTDLADTIIRRGTITEDERIALTRLLALLETANEAVRSDIDISFVEQANFSKHEGLIDALRGPTESAAQETRKLVRATAGGLVRPSTPGVDLARYREAARASFAAHRDLWSKLLDQQDAMLRIRKDGDEQRRLIALSLVLLAVAASVLLTFVIMRSITRPLRTAREVADRLARGELPDKVDAGSSVDETGSLLRAINNMLQFLDLKNMIATLQASTKSLGDAVVNLEQQTVEQNEVVTRQAAALQQTQVTAQEIKQTSQLAAQRAQSVLEVAERADNISRAGEAAIEQSLSGLTDIRMQVEGIAAKIGELNERTVRIGGITQTVKDLADQSNMLALNAAVEAVRSGEHGKGFGVVAREIRSLADQSIQSTNQVKEILDDISNAIRLAASITETGKQRMEVGVVQVKSSGENLRELSNIVRDNSHGVRQIAAAVNQQNVGISQIFGAVTEQTQMMNETVQRLDAIRSASATVKEVSSRVASVVKRYSI